MNSHPMSVTAHSGMLSKNPHSSMLVINSGGYNVCCGVEKPAEPIIVEIVPWMILNRASISSIAPLRPTLMTVLLCYPVSRVITSLMFALYRVFYEKAPQVPSSGSCERPLPKNDPQNFC